MIMIKGVHEGAPLAELDAWLAANGLKDSRWYMAEPRPYVEDEQIVITQVDTPKVSLTGWPIIQCHQGKPLVLIVRQPLLVAPSQSIIYRVSE